MKNMKKQRSTDHFDIKSQSPARAVTIEGFANKAVIDRGKDLIPPNAWKLSEFKKNNILLFNHNQDIPIGTVDAKVTDQGLMAKAKISKSNEAPIPYIRDMIKEGILKTFSVGFDSQGSEEKSEDGSHQVIKSANLLELSVVSVPMNQESTFDITKAMNDSVNTWKTKSYHQARNDMLLLKSAFLASAVHERIENLQNANPDTFDRDECLEKIMADSGVDEKKLDEILAGNDHQIPDKLLEAIASGLNLDVEILRSLAGVDTKSQDEDKEQNVAHETSKETDEDEKDEKAESEEEESEEEKSEDGKEEEEKEKSFEELVCEKIPDLVKDGMDGQGCIAVAVNMVRIEQQKHFDVSPEAITLFLEAYKAASISKTKNDEPTVNLDATSDVVENAQVSNPSMDQFKAQTTLMAQQNNLLQSVIDELKGLRSDLQMKNQETQEPENTGESDDKSESEDLDEKGIRMQRYLQKLENIEKFI